MQVDITPERIQAVPGVDTMIVVQVRNTSEVIGAYDVRVLGLDPRWLRIDGGRLSLFPDAAGMATIHVSLPDALPAGTRRLGIEVTSAVDGRSRLGEVEVVVPTVEKATISADPMSITAGRTAAVAVTIGNEGNRVLDAALEASDPEAKVDFEFEPPLLDVAPGDRNNVQVRATARRPIFGQPKVRVLTFSVPVGEPPPQAMITFIQRPIISRGLLGLLGLLAAVTVFAAVLTASLSQVVDVSKVDEELLLRAIQGPDTRGGPANPAAISGTVTSLTSGLPAGGVTVEVFPSDSAEQSLATDSTGRDGTYSLGKLEAGTYKVRFRGAGFTPLWYPSALDFPDGGEVEVEEGETKPGIDARMGGVPGVIAGKVIGDDPAGATLELLVPAAAIDAPTDAVVKSAPVDATGAFRLENVPSPGSYILQVSKTGFSKTRQAVRLEAGQTVEGVEILLRKGDGSIAGRVFGPDGPLGGVTVTATDGANTVATVSLTEGDVGAFFLRSIPTPGSFTISFAKAGFATETLSLNLSAAQELGGISATLSKGDGSISGTVSVVGVGPTGGVSVNVTNGEDTFDTVTLTEGAIGTWLVTGLPIPSTYTVTFSSPGLANQTRSVDVDPLAGGNVTGIDATLSRANGSIIGTVFARSGESMTPLGGATVTASGGGVSFITRSATVASSLADVGQYVLPEVPPGTYTVTFSYPGRAPVTTLVIDTAGQVTVADGVLEPLGSITVVVCEQPDCFYTRTDATVRLYVRDRYPQVLAVDANGTDEGGYFFPDLFGPENYIVEVYLGDVLQTPSTDVFLAPGEQKVVNVVRSQ